MTGKKPRNRSLLSPQLIRNRRWRLVLRPQSPKSAVALFPASRGDVLERHDDNARKHGHEERGGDHADLQRMRERGTRELTQLTTDLCGQPCANREGAPERVARSVSRFGWNSGGNRIGHVAPVHRGPDAPDYRNSQCEADLTARLSELRCSCS